MASLKNFHFESFLANFWLKMSDFIAWKIWCSFVCKSKGWVKKNRTHSVLYRFVICWPILMRGNAFFSWEYANFKMVKHVFLRWVVPEIWFDLSQIFFWEFHDFVNFSENACKIHKSSKTPIFFHDHISRTTQRRKTCFTILKFT